MERRDFLRTSAGFTAMAMAPGIWAVQTPEPKESSVNFQYTKADPDALAPILRVTPDDGHYIITYFDVTPWSPSQRYLAVTKVPELIRLPVLGDTAEVCVIDLEEQTIRTVYETTCWGYQTGANNMWGPTDRYLYTNDVIDGDGVCVRLDLKTGEHKAYVGSMYHIAPDGSDVIGFPPKYRSITQLGYGMPPKNYDELPSLPVGAATDEGVWKTNLATNKKDLLVSIADLVGEVPEPPPEENGTWYLWHTKYNPQGTRILQVLRCIFPGKWQEDPLIKPQGHPMVLAFDAAGENIWYTSPELPIWQTSGGHPNWHPDGEHILRHFRVEDGTKRYFLFKYDGSDMRQLSKKIVAGGHPSFEKSGRYIVTDDKEKNRDKGTMKIVMSLIDIEADDERVVCKLPTLWWENKYPHKLFELDGHPVWNRDTDKVLLQAATTPSKNRQLYMIDMVHLI